MYKDKEEQREANAERQRRYKAKHKGVTSKGVTIPIPEGVTLIGEPVKPAPTVKDLADEFVRNSPKRGKAIKYQMTVMERLFYRPANKLKPGETNFVSLPGRACYG